MNLKKIIRIFYLLYSVHILMVINTTSITFNSIYPAIILMWGNYFLFCAGFHLKKSEIMYLKTKSTDKNYWLFKKNTLILFVLASISVFSAIIAVKYYTGQTPVSTLKNILNNVSLYSEYQSYFSDQQRNIFSFNKLPYILMLFYIKLILFYSFATFLLVKDKITKKEKAYLVVITISFIYVGVARGTNFEFFELVVLTIFVILSRKTREGSILPVKSLLKVFILISFMVFIFYIGISSRGVVFNNYISSDVEFDSRGIIPLLSPFLSFVTLIIYGYFGFGFFYTSIFIDKLWFSSVQNFIAGFFPRGFQITGGDDLRETMSGLVDMGAKWQPDMVLITNNIGYIGLLLLCILMGYFSKKLSVNSHESPMKYFTNFIILLQMISLPIGNFVSTSSASQLVVVSLLLYWIWMSVVKKI